MISKEGNLLQLKDRRQYIMSENVNFFPIFLLALSFKKATQRRYYFLPRGLTIQESNQYYLVHCPNKLCDKV